MDVLNGINVRSTFGDVAKFENDDSNNLLVKFVDFAGPKSGIFRFTPSGILEIEGNNAQITCKDSANNGVGAKGLVVDAPAGKGILLTLKTGTVNAFQIAPDRMGEDIEFHAWEKGTGTPTSGNSLSISMKPGSAGILRSKMNGGPGLKSLEPTYKQLKGDDLITYWYLERRVHSGQIPNVTYTTGGTWCNYYLNATQTAVKFYRTPQVYINNFKQGYLYEILGVTNNQFRFKATNATTGAELTDGTVLVNFTFLAVGLPDHSDI